MTQRWSVSILLGPGNSGLWAGRWQPRGHRWVPTGPRLNAPVHTVQSLQLSIPLQYNRVIMYLLPGPQRDCAQEGTCTTFKPRRLRQAKAKGGVTKKVSWILSRRPKL